MAKLGVGLGIAGAVLAVACPYHFGRALWHPVYLELRGRRTVAEVVTAIGPSARARRAPSFATAGIDYPPRHVTMLAVKDAATLEVWVGPVAAPTFLRRYTIAALSGGPGPKLREGDRQVPEGFYQIEGLNPNSAYLLSMKLNYPNELDSAHAREEGRSQPGSNIFIHGRAVSIGCLAMGDDAIEELFVLVHDVGSSNVRVVIAPTDPPRSNLDSAAQPVWVAALYGEIERVFKKFRRPDAHVAPWPG